MDLLGLSGPSPDPSADPVPDGELICSATGCRAAAAWGLLWNNPKLPTPARRKAWLARDDHRQHLQPFPGSRSFWKQTVAVGELDRIS